MSSEAGGGPRWGLGPSGCLSLGPTRVTLTRRRLVRRWMPSVSNLQEEGTGTGLAWLGDWGPPPGRTALAKTRIEGVGQQGYLGAWLMSGCGRYRGKL